MDKSRTLSTLMVVRSLYVKKDPFRPKDEEEDILGPEVPYLSAVGALVYLANCTCPNIAFAINLLARYSYTPTRRDIGMESNKYYIISEAQLTWDYIIQKNQLLS